MGYYLCSIGDEYDDRGNYVGNSAEGNAFHGVAPTAAEGGGNESFLLCEECNAKLLSMLREPTDLEKSRRSVG